MKPQVQTEAGESLLQCLSALSDGEARAPDLDAALEAWRQNTPGVRQRWHAYAVIGDVLRSEDLGPRAAGHDEAFVARLRDRLAREPVVMAPTPLAVPQTTTTPAWNWRRLSAPMAMAAGVMTVVGVAVMMRPGLSDVSGTGGSLARAGAGAQQVALESAAAERAVSASGAIAGGVLLRDPLLDRYLEEHRLRSRGATVAVGAEDGLRQVGVQAR
ncbi:MAG: sigma-E factor negative regulatory protein [Burkholderiales bacterium]|nr:sigma-E factor negative regulatory protein [Burkholderiales bacterium]